MKFFLHDDTSVKVDKIIVSLKKLMDGDVSYQMKQKGLEYRKNYGTSIVWLRQLAQKYKGDNELANRLWHREIRETMILATLIAEPREELLLQLDDWAKIDDQDEIAEQLGVNLLYRLPQLNELSLNWLNQESEWKHAAVWVGLATYLQKGGNMTSKQVNMFLQLLKDSTGSTKFMLRVKGRFLRQLCRKSNNYLSMVEELLEELRNIKTKTWLVEDVQTEIDFVKGI